MPINSFSPASPSLPSDSYATLESFTAASNQAAVGSTGLISGVISARFATVVSARPQSRRVVWPQFANPAAKWTSAYPITAPVLALHFLLLLLELNRRVFLDGGGRRRQTAFRSFDTPAGLHLISPLEMKTKKRGEKKKTLPAQRLAARIM